MADSGLMCSFVANKNSYADPDKYRGHEGVYGSVL